MTKAEVIREFNELYPREVFMTPGSSGRLTLDKIARCEAWNNYTDSLCKDGRITDSEYCNWVSPF